MEAKPHSKYRGDSAAPEDERCTSSMSSGTVCAAHFTATTNGSDGPVNSRRNSRQKAEKPDLSLSPTVRAAAGPIVTDSSRSVARPTLCTERRRYEQSAERLSARPIRHLIESSEAKKILSSVLMNQLTLRDSDTRGESLDRHCEFG